MEDNVIIDRDYKTQMKKPLVGATPYYRAAVSRSNELISAIGRYLNDAPLTKAKIKEVKLWAVELGEQIDLISTMFIYDGEI